MDDIKEKCQNTTRHIADKILYLRRANKLTQESFAEKVNLDRRTIARAEDGIHRPAAETLEIIAMTFDVPISYFYDNSIYKKDISKISLLHEINTKLNIMPKSKLKTINKIIDIIE